MFANYLQQQASTENIRMLMNQHVFNGCDRCRLIAAYTITWQKCTGWPLEAMTLNISQRCDRCNAAFLPCLFPINNLDDLATALAIINLRRVLVFGEVLPDKPP